MQGVLLRFLDTGEIQKVGSDRVSMRVDVRVIAATNRNLEVAIRAETFRRDLFFRLAGFEISLQPLRERPEDILVLADHFLNTAQVSPPPAGFTAAARQTLQHRAWHGNVRELRNTVEHAAILARGLAITPDHFPQPLQLGIAATTTPAQRIAAAIRDWATAQLATGPQENLYEQCLAQIEPPLLEAVLEHTQDNRAAAADILGIHRGTLRKKLS